MESQITWVGKTQPAQATLESKPQRWTVEAIEHLFKLPFNDLLFKAQQVHREHFDANAVQLSTLLSIKTGGCPEDCAYCPQSAKYDTGVDAEKLMPLDEVLKAAQAAKDKGATRFCMGAAWRSPKDHQIEQVSEMIAGVKQMEAAIAGVELAVAVQTFLLRQQFTTGIDVPPICHLVFMRRVKSRILYEQMIGRATRRCDEIGKTVFKIYDPVDLYASLENVNTMKPLVKDPSITIEQLVDELNNPTSYQTPGSTQGRTHAHDALDQLNQKLMRVLRDAKHKAEKKPVIKDKLDQLEQQWGVPAHDLHKHLHKLGQENGPQAAADFLNHNTRLLIQLAEVRELIGTAYRPVLSTHADELKERNQNWGPYNKPDDYLDSFVHFVREQINQSAALAVVVNRPKDLTREQLKEVRMLLDGQGYSEANLKAAWRSKSNQDIAASIMGYIRQAALGEALLPFETRVANAMQNIYAKQAWTPIQRKWLDRIAKQLTHELVLDNGFVTTAFANDGGATRLDKILDGQLGQVISDLSASLWAQAA